EVYVGARRVFGRKLDVVGERARQRHGLARLLERLVAADLQLVLKVNVGGSQERVDARARGSAERLPGALDVGAGGARQPGDDRAADLPRDGLHGLEVAIGSDGEARLNDVDAEPVELPRHADLLRQVHAATGRLLAVPERRVKDFHLGSCHSAFSSIVRVVAYRAHGRPQAAQSQSYNF